MPLFFSSHPFHSTPLSHSFPPPAPSPSPSPPTYKNRNSVQNNVVYNFVSEIEYDKEIAGGASGPQLKIHAAKKIIASGGDSLEQLTTEAESQMQTWTGKHHALIPKPRLGSPGNKGTFATGPSAVVGALATESDPFALRTSMGATHEGMERSLAMHEPDQLMEYAWSAVADEILTDNAERGLPPVPGETYPWARDPKKFVASW